ncbi:MAG: pYEATS domain-containing protein, partial [Vicinamibacteria bacterium]
GLGYDALYKIPGGLSRWQALILNPERSRDLEFLRHSLESIFSRRQSTARIDPEDPQKHQWGGKIASNGREIRARIKPITDEWFDIDLEVISIATPLMEGAVEFHLHPTFEPAVRTVAAENGRAGLNLKGWGAFTVGVSAEGGRTRLELDLSGVTDAPTIFRER